MFSRAKANGVKIIYIILNFGTQVNEKIKRLDELNILLNMDKRENEILDEKEDTAVETTRETGEIER